MNTTASKRLSPFLAAAMLLALTGCYEPQEGCLDITAVNFNLEADRPCGDDCCNYPQFRFDFRHVYRLPGVEDSPRLGFRDSVYVDAQGHPFRIDTVLYFISDAKIIHPDNSETGVLADIAFRVVQPGGDTVPAIAENNFLLVDARAQLLRSVGNFQGARPVAAVRFLPGLDEGVRNAVPSSFPATHPLASRANAPMHEPAEGYLMARLALFRDTVSTDTITRPVRIRHPALVLPVILQLPSTFEPLEGANFIVEVEVNVAEWFQDCDVRNDSEEVLAQKIAARMGSSFRFIRAVSSR